jgi:hypothetical protein
MQTSIPIYLNYKPKISVQDLVCMMSRIFQFNMSTVFYQYLEFYSSNLGHSSSI